MHESGNRKLRKRLERKTIIFQQFRSALIMAAVIGVFSVCLMVWVYLQGYMSQGLQMDCQIAVQIENALEDDNDLESWVSQVMEIYDGQHDQKMDRRSETAYFSMFADIATNEEYQLMTRELDSALSVIDNNMSIVLAGIDEENNVLVNVATSSKTDLDIRIGTLTRLPPWFGVTSDPNTGFPSSYYYDLSQGLVGIAGTFLNGKDASAGCLFILTREEKLSADMLRLVLVCMPLVALSFLVIWVFLKKRITKSIVRPINSIGIAARNYTSDRLAGNFDTQHYALLDIQTGNEIDDLAQVLADMEHDLSGYVHKLTRVTAENERRHAELEMAAQIQRDAMPREFPERDEFDVFATMNPAREVGGDFYDLFFVDDDHLCLVIADVSDKGVPAALFMMTTKTVVADYMMAGMSPSEGLANANEMICKHNRSGMFVTIWVGVLELSTGVLRFANAGHEYPAFSQLDGTFALYKSTHGLVAGAMSGMPYAEREVLLRPGAKVFVYTDGVPEATNAQREQFGLDRMVDALNEAKDGGPRQILHAVRHAVDEFVQDAEQFDDLTMLCLEYHGASCASPQDEEGSHHEG